MLISEIFYSLQGEGSLAGMPSVFIRTSGCNLRCSWCDTPYASWKPEGGDRSVGEIVEQVKSFPGRHCVLTGGEPMIARGIHDLAASLRAEGFHITIETAGTIAPGGIACDLASISPKLANSTPATGEIEPSWIARHEAARIQPAVLREWIAAYPVQLKFVLASAEDLVEVDRVLASVDAPVAPSQILLMPEATNPATLGRREPELVGICLERGYRYCDRLHIRLFGNRRGT